MENEGMGRWLSVDRWGLCGILLSCVFFFCVCVGRSLCVAECCEVLCKVLFKLRHRSYYEEKNSCMYEGRIR